MDRTSVFIGMDLGTFKTSVASSTGTRDVVYSSVGWPKDHIARSLLGRDVVFGNELIEQRLALEVVRPFEKGVLKYADCDDVGVSQDAVAKHREAARLLVEHAVSLTRPPQGATVFGVIGAPARATIHNKKFVLDACRTAFDASMIVSEPFSIAYGMNRLANTLVIDIGAGTIDLCPIYGTFPTEEDQITLSLGGDYIDEHFLNYVRQEHPEAQVSLNMIREIKEKHGFVNDINEKALVMLPVAGKPRQFDVTEPLKAACRMIVPPIVEAVQNLVGRVDPEYQQRLLNNIVLGGGGSQLKGLDLTIEQALKEYGGAKVKRVGDAVFAGAAGALKLAMSMPPECWKQIKHTPPAAQPVRRAA